MSERTFAETLKENADAMMAKLRELIKEGNVRRVVIQHGGKTVAEFPLTAGVVGTMVAPVLAAIGALVALLQDCTIQVERVQTGAPSSTDRAADDSSRSAS